MPTRIKPHPLAKVARNAEIVRRHVEDGATLTALGQEFGLTRERVRQLVAAAGVRPVTERKREQRELIAVAEAIIRWVKWDRARRHGTKLRYDKLGCRCRECRAANAAYYRERFHRTHPEAARRPPEVCEAIRRGVAKAFGHDD